MKVYAITIEDAHGEYGRLYALADNDSDKLRLEEMAQAETMGDDTEVCVREIELNIPIKTNCQDYGVEFKREKRVD